MVSDVIFMGILMVAGGLAFCLFGGGVSMLAVRSMKRILATRSWPSVQGNVLSSYVEEHTWTKKGGAYDHSSFNLLISYEYFIGAKRFHSDQAATQTGRSYGTREVAESQAAKSQVGSEIKVYYDPVNPAESTLTNKFSFKPFFGLLFGLTFLVLGVVTLISSMGQFCR